MLKTTLSALVLSGLLGTQALAQTIFVNDAKVVTNSAAGTLETADVLIENGRVTNMSAQLSAPNGAKVIEAKGLWLTPGLFAPMTQMGLAEINSEDSVNDSSARKANTSVSDRGADSFNPNSPVIDMTRVGGITHAAVSPSASHNIFGGIGFVANTSGDLKASIEDETAFVFVQLGEQGTSLAGGSRSAAMNQLRAALNDASSFKARYNGPDDGDALSRRDAAALGAVISGGMPLVIGADRASDLINIIDLKNDYKSLNIIIYGGAEGWMVAKDLAANNIRVMIDPHENLPESFEQTGARLDGAALMAKAGVDIALTTRVAGISHNIRVLRQHAGNAVANGLDWDTAFKAISRTPAAWFKIKTGTIETGSDTLVLWSGDPLEVTSAPVLIMINGEEQSLKSRQTALRDRYNPVSKETKPFKYR